MAAGVTTGGAAGGAADGAAGGAARGAARGASGGVAGDVAGGPAGGAGPWSWLANPRATRETLERHGFVTKHRLGQNFLVSDAVIGKILALAELGPKDVVLEVGPGIGTLTVALLAHAGAVVAIERDPRLPPVLAETCAKDGERLSVIEGDALRVGEEQIARAVTETRAPAGTPLPTKLVSNLPYQVAATVVLGTLERLPSVGRLVVMVQAEVADRMAAMPGSKSYGAYTAKLGLLGRVDARFGVAASNFLPAPHVSSAVVRIDRWGAGDAGAPTEPAGGELSDDLRRRTCQVIDAAFAQRRKTVRNSMAASGFGRERLEEALARAGIDPGCRAETLATQDFIALAAALGPGSLGPG